MSERTRSIKHKGLDLQKQKMGPSDSLRGSHHDTGQESLTHPREEKSSLEGGCSGGEKGISLGNGHILL